MIKNKKIKKKLRFSESTSPNQRIYSHVLIHTSDKQLNSIHVLLFLLKDSINLLL